jgi:hypothetical protein
MFRRAQIAGLVVTCAACAPSTPLAAVSDAGPQATTPLPAQQSIAVFDAARISSASSDPNFQELSADLDLSGGPFLSATLIVDLATTCVPFSSWADDPPPKGQNWPADCDAFDRNFEISLDGPEPSDAGVSAASGPGLELVRAITPFGGPMHVERDLTTVANGLPGMHRIRARINTFSDPAGLVTGSAAGWNVSLKVELSRGAAPHHPLAVVPLFYGDLTTADPVSASFTVPAGTSDGFFEYRTTGHGQAAGDLIACNGPAEEFCRRQHTLTLDGAPLKSFTPWRACAASCTLAKTEGDAGVDYCVENPCGAVASVKAARANWCPGSESPPLTIDAPELATPGAHDVSWQVSQIASGGSVRVSLTYYAFGD